MRVAGYVFCLLLLVVEAVASDITLQITDKSIYGSPVENVGSCVLSDQPVSGKVYVSDEDTWTVRNVSQKKIVALVETLSITYPTGQVVTQEAQHERFFHPELLNQGDTTSFKLGRDETHVIDESKTQPTEALCELEVRWIQFADGTTFGDSKYGAPMLETRRRTLDALMHLNDVYTKEGANAFVEQLGQHIEPLFAEAYIAHLRRLYEANGHDVKATVETLRMHIEMAKQRSGLMQIP